MEKPHLLTLPSQSLGKSQEMLSPLIAKGEAGTVRTSCADERSVPLSMNLSGQVHLEQKNKILLPHISLDKIDNFSVHVWFCLHVSYGSRHTGNSHPCSFEQKGSGVGTQISLRHQIRTFEPELQIPCELKLYYYFIFSRSLFNPAPKPKSTAMLSHFW